VNVLIAGGVVLEVWKDEREMLKLSPKVLLLLSGGGAAVLTAGDGGDVEAAEREELGTKSSMDCMRKFPRSGSM